MNELRHYGVLGMKWGVRRYQNKDGSYTAAGKKRYSHDPATETNPEASKSSHAVKRFAEIERIPERWKLSDKERTKLFYEQQILADQIQKSNQKMTKSAETCRKLGLVLTEMQEKDAFSLIPDFEESLIKEQDRLAKEYLDEVKKNIPSDVYDELWWDEYFWLQIPGRGY